MPRVLGIAGSLRRDSHNRKLLRAAGATLPSWASFAELEMAADLPLYDQDLDAGPGPPQVRELRRRIADADALLIATPEYNGSIPGPLKNAIDWASRPYETSALRGKPALVIGASTGLFGAVWAQAELRKVLGVAGASPLDHELPVGRAGEAFDERGALVEPELESLLRAMVADLVAQAGDHVERAGRGVEQVA